LGRDLKCTTKRKWRRQKKKPELNSTGAIGGRENESNNNKRGDRKGKGKVTQRSPKEQNPNKKELNGPPTAIPMEEGVEATTALKTIGVKKKQNGDQGQGAKGTLRDKGKRYGVSGQTKQQKEKRPEAGGKMLPKTRPRIVPND